MRLVHGSNLNKVLNRVTILEWGQCMHEDTIMSGAWNAMGGHVGLIQEVVKEEEFAR